MKFFFFLFFSGLIFPQPSFAEILGDIGINDVSIAPQFTYKESEKSNFSLGYTSFGIRWQKLKYLSAQLRVGSKSLVNQPSFFNSKESKGIGFYEAYGEINNSYGRFRGGLVPLDFGYEGSQLEHEIYFSRNLFFEKRLAALRGFGFSYYIKHYYGLFTELTVHNGEGLGENKDGRGFYTATWGFEREGRIKLGLSAQSGRTSSESTIRPFAGIIDFATDRDSKFYITDAFFHFKKKYFILNAEFYLGRLTQELPEENGGDEGGDDDGSEGDADEIPPILREQRTYFNSGHVDLIYDSSSRWMFLLRYDFLRPNRDIKSKIIEEVTLGIGVRSKQLSSALYLLATKVSGSNFVDHQKENRYMLIWKLTPKF